MKSVAIPHFMHEALGESQSIASLTSVFGFGVLGTALLAFVGADLFHQLAWWRSLLALILIFDILAGCVANFTRGTNDYYRSRPRGRWIFVAIHVHLPLVALLLGADLMMALVVWAYTIAGAALVNLARFGKGQPVMGGLLLAFGLLAAPLLALSPMMLAVAQLFLLKVLYAFAVDHYRA
ncbi:MAG: hypothetical protein ACXIVF_10720 [Rhizobiaceae bacterium]